MQSTNLLIFSVDNTTIICNFRILQAKVIRTIYDEVPDSNTTLQRKHWFLRKSCNLLRNLRL